MKLRVECWRPVFNNDFHTLDVFSPDELNQFGGGGGFVLELKRWKITASVEKDHGLPLEPGSIVIKHKPDKGAHDIYTRLKLKQGKMIITA